MTEPQPRKPNEVDIAQDARGTAEYVRALYALASGEELEPEDYALLEDGLDPETAEGEPYDAAMSLLDGWLLEVERWRSSPPHDGRRIDCAVTLGGPTVRFQYESGGGALHYFHSWGHPSQDYLVHLTAEQCEAFEWLVEMLVPEGGE